MEDPRVPNIAYHRVKVALSIIEEIVAQYRLLLYCILVLRLKFDVKVYQAGQKLTFFSFAFGFNIWIDTANPILGF